MSFFDELKRRNVVRVGLAYGIAGWVFLQVADLVLQNIEAPPWVIQALMPARLHCLIGDRLGLRDHTGGYQKRFRS